MQVIKNARCHFPLLNNKTDLEFTWIRNSTYLYRLHT